MHANAIKTDGRIGEWVDLQKFQKGLCTCFRAHGLDPLGSMSLETQRNRFWPTACARQRDQDGWADGWTCKNRERDFAQGSRCMVSTLWAACFCKLHIKLKLVLRIVLVVLRCCSGSSSPITMTSTHHHGPSSTAPRVHLHQARCQPCVLLQVCLAWYLAAAACSSIPPPLRPPLCVAPSGLFGAKIAWLPF